MDHLNCYICNKKTKLQNCVKIRAKTKYTNISINEIVSSFLKETHLLRFSANDIVCPECYEKLNKYDLACRMASEIQQEITDALYVTEHEYLYDGSIEYLEDDKDDISELQNDFDEYVFNTIGILLLIHLFLENNNFSLSQSSKMLRKAEQIHN